MNENAAAFWMILAAAVCGGFGVWCLHLLSAEHNVVMAQLSKRSKRHENLFKPEYDRIMAMPSQLNDHQGWVAMMQAVVAQNPLLMQSPVEFQEAMPQASGKKTAGMIFRWSNGYAAHRCDLRRGWDSKTRAWVEYPMAAANFPA
jgi:hypothetical protein